MTIIHTNDPTTRFLSLLYDSRDDVVARVSETYTNSDVIRALKADDSFMMLGHGNLYGLFSVPDKKGVYNRLLITDRHVEFLRNKICIGIWCHADMFARQYGLHGLFSGMIISEVQEAADYNISATKEEIDLEMVKFTQRLRDCIADVGLEATPERMRSLDDSKSELTLFNYSRLYYL